MPLRFNDALCAVDGSDESIAAIEAACSLLQPDAQLTLLIATAFRRESEIRSPAIPPARATGILERALATAARAGRGEPSVEVDPSGPPAELILERASRHDLLAIGAPADTSVFGALFLSGVSEIAQELLQTPLLIARQRSHEAPHLLVASDGLDPSDGLVELAGALARAQGASTTLVHVLGAESRAHPHRIEHQAQKLKDASPAARSSLRVEVGSARELIVELAREERASLILMSSRRLSGLTVLGSVSRPVVAHAGCSVLLVPPESLLAGTRPGAA